MINCDISFLALEECKKLNLEINSSFLWINLKFLQLLEIFGMEKQFGRQKIISQTIFSTSKLVSFSFYSWLFLIHAWNVCPFIPCHQNPRLLNSANHCSSDTSNYLHMNAMRTEIVHWLPKLHLSTEHVSNYNIFCSKNSMHSSHFSLQIEILVPW